MTKKAISLLALIFFIVTSFIAGDKDELYLNYVEAIKNESTFQYFLVVKIKDLKSKITREYCTQGNFFKGALHMEYKIGYNFKGFSKVYSLAIDNKERYFEFRKRKSIKNISAWTYSIEELEKLEKIVNFDSIATQIKKDKKWSMAKLNDKTMLMYAHALFNKGILTGENSCFGGTLVYIDRNQKQE